MPGKLTVIAIMTWVMGNGEEMWMRGKLTVIAIMTLKIAVYFSRRGTGEGDVRVIIFPSVHPRTRSNFVLTLGTPF